MTLFMLPRSASDMSDVIVTMLSAGRRARSLHSWIEIFAPGLPVEQYSVEKS